MAQFFPCPHCDSVHRTLVSLSKHHLQDHEQEHWNYIKEYLPALSFVRLTCIFCHRQFPTKKKVVDHYKVCRCARIQTLDEQRLNGIVAWNKDVWLTSRFKSSILQYLSWRPPPKIPKRETLNSIQKLDKITKLLKTQIQRKQPKVKKTIIHTARLPCPECDLDYKYHKDLKDHFRDKHPSRPQSEFINYYYPILRKLEDCSDDSELIDPMIYPKAIRNLSSAYMQKLQGYYFTRLSKQ